MKSKEFHVLYTRMGEPFLNIDNVIDSIYELVNKYPHIKIGLSTCGVRDGVEKLLNHPKIATHIMMQFSAHGTDEETRSELLGMSTESQLMSLKNIADFTKKFRKLNKRKVSLNFVLLDKFDYDFKKLKKYFDTDDVYLRLSPLNVTKNSSAQSFEGLLQEYDVLHKAPFTSEKLKQIIKNAKESGFAYAYAPAIDEEIKYNAACGQALEALSLTASS
jgi:23S rRNA (adenine2503-C2)-methyltransferase